MNNRGDRGSQRCTQCSRTGAGACCFVPLSRAGLEAFALNEIAEYAAGIGSDSKKLFVENAMRDLTTTLCRGAARQVMASMPLQARMDGRAVIPGLSVPTDGLLCVQHAAMQVCVWVCMPLRALRASSVHPPPPSLLPPSSPGVHLPH